MAEEYDQHVEYRQNKFMRFNKEWYDDLRASKPNWTKVSAQRIHENRGYPVHVKAGQVFKAILPSESNIIDVWFFSEGIKKPSDEQYDLLFTAGLEGFILRKNSRMWSNLPYFRPIATYIDDNIDPAAMPDEHHWPVWHGGHCCPELIESGHGKLEHNSCHTNCIEALVRAGYDFEAADALACSHNMCIFQPMAITDQPMPAGHISPTWHNSPSKLKPGTFVEYYAEIDLLIAVAHCPYGNQSKPPYQVDHYPVDVEVWDTGIQPQERPPWTEWRPAFKARLERLKAAGHEGPTGRYYSDD